MWDALDSRGFAIAAVAKRIDIKEKTLRNYLTDVSEPKFETLLQFCEIVGIDVSDIIRRDDDGPLNMALEPDNDEFVKINVYDVDLAAGEGRVTDNESPIDQLAFRSAWLDRAGINPAYASIVRVEGNSMEPTLQNKSVVLIDHRDKTPISKNYIFAVRVDEALKVKRVERDPTNKVVMLHSDNPEVPTEALRTDELNGFEIIGRVVWTARTFPS
ncbi:MAG: helix-turn-helix domain-containing protein [Rhodobacteraceae bacterium]|nr:helix-turn-helix domain-containing protein [Paracoccaceae bacterium]